MLRSTVVLLKGDQGAAIGGFETALKSYRQNSGSRNAIFTGLSGYLHVLALLRSDDDKLKKRAQAYLETAMRMPGANASAFARLTYLNLVQTGQQKVSDNKQQVSPQAPLSQLIAHLVDFWLGAPQTEMKTLLLMELFLKSEAAGFHFITMQAAALLERTSDKLRAPEIAEHLARAAALRAQHGMVLSLIHI